jgi:hypothetical protein
MTAPRLHPVFAAIIAGFMPPTARPDGDAPNDTEREDAEPCTRSGYDFCDGPCKRCDERAEAALDNEWDNRREEAAIGRDFEQERAS